MGTALCNQILFVQPDWHATALTYITAFSAKAAEISLGIQFQGRFMPSQVP